MCAFKLNSNWLTLLFTCFYLVGWCDVSNGAFAWTSVRVWRKSCGQHPAIPVASTRAWRDRSNGTWWVLSCCCRVLTAAGGSGAERIGLRWFPRKGWYGTVEQAGKLQADRCTVLPSRQRTLGESLGLNIRLFIPDIITDLCTRRMQFYSEIIIFRNELWLAQR